MRLITAAFATLMVSSVCADSVVTINHVSDLHDGEYCGSFERHGQFQVLNDYASIELLSTVKKGLTCSESYALGFPRVGALHQYAMGLDLPGYSFQGIDYAIYDGLVEHAVSTGDPVLYRHYLQINTANVVSEEIAPMLSKLRGNPDAFLKAYCQLDVHQGNVVERQQFDFNVPLSAHLLKSGGTAECRGRWNEQITETYELLTRK